MSQGMLQEVETRTGDGASSSLAGRCQDHRMIREGYHCHSTRTNSPFLT